MSNHSPNPEARLYTRSEIAWTIALILAAASLAVWLAAQTELGRIEGAFRDQATAHAQNVDDTIAEAGSALTAMVGLEYASDELLDHEVAGMTRELLAAYPQIEAIGRLKLVAASDRANVEQRRPANGIAAFRVRELSANGELQSAQGRNRHLSLLSLDPFGPTAAHWIGFDLLSAQPLAIAAEDAIASGGISSAHAVSFPDRDHNLYLIKAVYRGYGKPASREDRITQARGAYVAVLHAEDLLSPRSASFDSVELRSADDQARSYRIALRPQKSAAVAVFHETVWIDAFGQPMEVKIDKAVTLSMFRLWPLALGAFLPIVIAALAWNAHAGKRQANRRAAAAQATLELSEERFRDYAIATADLFWEMDADLRFSYLSDQYQSITGNPPSALLGKTRQESGLPGVDPEVYAQHLDDLENRRPFRNFIHPRAKEDGEIVWVAVNGKPIYDKAGAFIGYRGTGRYITDVIQRERELATAKADAEAANQAKSAFLAAMSHELRTPLNAVVGFAEILQARMKPPLGDAENAEFAEHIHTSGMHLLNLINDLLDLSKIESGKDQLREDSVDALHVAQSAERMVSKRAAEGGVQLSVDVGESARRLTADRRKLLQILVNLMSNAVKFTPKNGVVSLRVSRDHDGATVFQVRDTGIGISETDIPKALSPFEQIDNRMTREYEGTGLGLPLTQKLTEQHGGDLTIESAVGEGTTVTVRFPPERGNTPTYEAEAQSA